MGGLAGFLFCWLLIALYCSCIGEQILSIWYSAAYQADQRVQRLLASKSASRSVSRSMSLDTSPQQSRSLTRDSSDLDDDLSDESFDMETERKLEEQCQHSTNSQSMTLLPCTVNDVSNDASRHWLKKSVTTPSLTNLIAINQQNALLGSNGIVDDIGPPIVARTISLVNNDTKSLTTTKSASTSFSFKESSTQIQASSRPNSAIPLADLVTHDPLLNKKKVRTMMTMKAHLNRTQQDPSIAMTIQGSAPHGLLKKLSNHPHAQSISTSALANIPSHSNTQSVVNQRHSTGQLRSLAQTSHL
jgi:hypothetical protein